MDLKNENSGFESLEVNEAIPYPFEKLDKPGGTRVGSNGTSAHEQRDNGNGNVESGEDSTAAVFGKSSASPSSPSPSPSPGGTKGKGLKKWRRIKRDVIKDGGTNVDASKLLKRGLSNSGANLNRAMQVSGGMKQKSEGSGSVSSTDALLRSPGNRVDPFAAIGDLGIGAGAGNGSDSEYSEDRSSKSSTAASAPKMAGHALEKNRLRNLGGKYLGGSAQRGQTGKGRSETSKKFRGEVVKIEKENSHSSMESDSRSSNFVFMQGINSPISNGRQSGRSLNYDGENSDEAQGTERQPSEELQVDSSGKNGVAFEDNYQEESAADSSWGTKGRKSENNGPSMDDDPLLDSISSLQSAKEALEKEIHKFMEIGKGDSTIDDSVPDGPLDRSQFGDLGEKSFDSLEPVVISLKQTMKVLENKLNVAEALLKVKEAIIVDLHESTSSGKSAKIETRDAKQQYHQNHRDLGVELEDLFKQKIEGEVEYVAVSKAVQNLRGALADQITILEEQRAEQAWMLNKLGDAGVKAAQLQGEAEKLENYCEDVVSIDETIQLKTGICKHISCFFIQLILLLTILILFIWKLLPNYSEVVPT